MKTTKTQIWNSVQGLIETNSDLFKKGQHETMIELLAELLAPGTKASTKINADGDVYCSYFAKYMPASSFATKLGKPNANTGERREGYKSNSIDAEQIIRKVRSLVKGANAYIINLMTIAAFKDDEAMHQLLALLDEMSEAHYDSLQDVPTIADFKVAAAQYTKDPSNII